MKKIAITQRLILNSSYYEVREALDINWGKFMKELNFLPIILSSETKLENYFESIKIDGILLTGGNDLTSLNSSVLSKKRDVFEKKLIEYGVKNHIPIFGVCRGMQIIGEYFGSTFKQVNQVNLRHKLVVNRESLFSDNLSILEDVNSFHSFAIDKLNNKNLIISAYDEHGTIKAIEHKYFNIFAQMWHSEREKPFKEDEMNLIKFFFNRKID